MTTNSPIRQSDKNIGALYAALAAARLKFGTIEKLREGEVKGTAKNSGREYKYNYNYADLFDVLEAVAKPLAEQGITIIQIPYVVSRSMILVTRLAFKNGMWIEGDYPVTTFGDAWRHQELGGYLTYAKRQGLSAILSVAAEDDKDAADGETRDDNADEARFEPVQAGTRSAGGPPRPSSMKAAPEPASTTSKLTPKEQETLSAAVASIRSFNKLEELRAWHKEKEASINAQSMDWRDEFYSRYDDRASELKPDKATTGAG